MLVGMQMKKDSYDDCITIILNGAVSQKVLKVLFFSSSIAKAIMASVCVFFRLVPNNPGKGM